jgi:hypothetical protein
MDTPAATMIDGSKPFACSEAGCNEVKIVVAEFIVND